MIEVTEAKQYLDQVLGVSVPDFLLEACVDTVGAVEPAMRAAGYSQETMLRIQCMATAIIAAAGDPRRVTSQGAASGASRGFKYKDSDVSALRRSLLALDTAGTVTALIGPDPAAATMFFVTC